MKNAEQSIPYRQENISGLRGVSLYAGHPIHGNTLSIGFLQYYGLEYYDVLNRIILWICTAEQPIPIFGCPLQTRQCFTSPRVRHGLSLWQLIECAHLGIVYSPIL